MAESLQYNQKLICRYAKRRHKCRLFDSLTITEKKRQQCNRQCMCHRGLMQYPQS